MNPTVGEFNFTRLESVLYGPGKISMLWRELSKRNARRAVIVTSKTLGKSKLLDKVKDAAGSALAGVFRGTLIDSERDAPHLRGEGTVIH